MFIKVNSTRHTKVGLFRRGVVYDVDKKNRKVMEAIRPLMDGQNPALQEISAADAKKSKAQHMQEKNSAPDGKATNADLRQKLKVATEAQKEAEAETAEAEQRADDLERDLEESERQKDELKGKLEAVENELAQIKDQSSDEPGAKK